MKITFSSLIQVGLFTTGVSVASSIFAPSFSQAATLYNPPTPEIPGVTSLNLPLGNPASSYTICTNQNSSGASQKSLIDSVTDPELGKCSNQPGDPMATIHQVLAEMLSLSPEASLIDSIFRPTQTVTGLITLPNIPTLGGSNTPGGSTTTLTATGAVNVVEINADFSTSTNCTYIDLVGNADSIFILRSTSNSARAFGASSGNTSHCGVQFRLKNSSGILNSEDGIQANNIFWAFNSNVRWNEVSSSTSPEKRHVMAGTFLIDPTGTSKWQTLLLNGRILGGNGIPSASNFGPNTEIFAISQEVEDDLQSVPEPSLIFGLISILGGMAFLKDPK